MTEFRIQLKHGLSALVDEDVYAWAHQLKWREHWAGRNNKVYAVRSGNRGQTIYLHREVMPGVKIVDHINGDTLDNRRSNLRAATPALNVQNIHAEPRSSTGVRYVFRQRNRFIARIGRDGVDHYLGTFGSVEAAKRAVDLFMDGKWSMAELTERLARLEAENAELRAASA